MAKAFQPHDKDVSDLLSGASELMTYESLLWGPALHGRPSSQRQPILLRYLAPGVLDAQRKLFPLNVLLGREVPLEEFFNTLYVTSFGDERRPMDYFDDRALGAMGSGRVVVTGGPVAEE
jgi:hypothetical protein